VTTGSDRFKKAINWYSSNDWQVLPCHGIVEGRCTCGQKHEESKDIGKHPAINAWNRESTSDIEKLTSWWESNPEYNVGINCKTSGFFVIDIDPRSGGEDSFEKFESYVEGALPPTAEATTGKYEINGKVIYGRHIYYKCDINEDLIGNLSKLGFKGIDIKHNGYVLVSPSRHFSGVTYEWVKGKEPWNTPIAEAPEDLLKALRKRQRYTAGGNSYESADWDSVKGMGLDIDKVLEQGLVEGERATGLFQLACALANKFGTKTEAQRLAVETLMIRFNAEKVVPPLPLEGAGGLLMHARRAIVFVTDNPLIDKIWPGAAEYANNMIEDTRRTQEGKEEIQTLLGVVQPINDFTDYTLPGNIGSNVFENINSGMSLDEASSNTAMEAVTDVDALRDEDKPKGWKGRSLSDTGNGRRLIDSFGEAIRYTPGLGWFTWTGGFWKPDKEALQIQEISKKLGSLIVSEAIHWKKDPEGSNKLIQWGAQAKSEARLKSAINNANSDPRITVDVDKWDQDPYMLGVTNGVVDLRTGELIKGNPKLYITKRAPVAYTRGLTNMRWQQFLDFATDGDKEFQEWIQRAAGYSLTGLSRYDILFLVYGPAGSGKNTLVEAIVKCLGSSQYAFPLDSSILALDGGSSRSTDLYHWAEMRGRRMVWVDELPDNERIKENSVKKLTGSSEISARSPGEKPFTFQSQAKLWITTNHRPIITDDAMWRRIRPIPMIKTPEKADPGLKEYIFDPDGALPAVLSWAVEGAIKVLGSSQKDGLGWCKAVSEAAEMYRKNEDRIALFLEEELIVAVGATITVKQVFQLYRTWSEDRGERPMTQIAFDRKLRERNLKIEGSGAKATIFDRYMSPRQVPLGSSADWGLLSATARNL